MRELRSQFSELYRTLSGNKFYGELSNPLERTTPSDFRPRRSLSVSKQAAVTTGDVIQANNTQFLVALSASFQSTNQLKCFEITHTLAWSRQSKTTDLVTGLPKDSGLQVLNPTLPVVVEYGQVTHQEGLEGEKYKILTGANVMVGDRLGPWLVQSVREAYGLKLIEVS